MPVALFVVLVVVGTSIWVLADSSSLGARQGVLGGGLLDMGSGTWFAACLLLWIIAFPCYMVARPRYVALRTAGAHPAAQPWTSPGEPPRPHAMDGHPGPPNRVRTLPGFTDAENDAIEALMLSRRVESTSEAIKLLGFHAQPQAPEPWTSPEAQPPVPSQPKAAGIADELERLATLRQSGALSEAEFSLLKSRLLSLPPE